MMLNPNSSSPKRKGPTLCLVLDPPCESCGKSMQDFCGSKGIKCKAFDVYEETGIALVRSPSGWRIPGQGAQ